MPLAVLLPNERRDLNMRVTNEVAERLTALGFECRVSDTEALKEADIAVTLGGDGTILRYASFTSRYNVPILGINLGHLGFLAELEPTELDLLDKIDEHYIETRMMLDVAIINGKTERHADCALNDAIISGGATARVVELMVSAANEPLTSFLGDGAVVSTPTGSTAYSMSAGGPIIEPHIENIVITPVCPHDLRARAFVLSGDSDVQVTPLHSRGHSAFLTVDGRDAVFINAGELVRITRSKRVTQLIRLKKRNFYKIIAEKLA